MTFIETLKSAGCFKECTCETLMDPKHCPSCHGNGCYIDLAPLLAEPELLNQTVQKLYDGFGLREKRGNGRLYVVGPQRASNLVYEVSHHLGGTAVVARNPYDGYFNKPYALSVAIPDNASVLFVTDRMEVDEMNEVIKATNPKKPLPYILSLIAKNDEFRHSHEVDAVCPNGLPNSWQVIALHKE
jgi:hypothetical protein